MAVRKTNSSILGFTLIELITSVAVLAIIATISVVALDPFTQFQKAGDARIKSDLSQIEKSFELYYEDNGKYPDATASYKINSLGGEIDWGTAWQPYMNILPKDPRSNRNYVYYSPSDGQSYYIYANLNREEDTALCNSDGSACSSLSQNGVTEDCGAVCNFGVSSQNVSP
ncbi:MAG TPA: type II secretion system protein GspG [Patescibacteria group bacterium]|nr:type II secretion system protein GspG [Patescibacteria group bacterium]